MKTKTNILIAVLFLMGTAAFGQSKGKKSIGSNTEGYGYVVLDAVPIIAKGPTKRERAKFEKKKKQFNKLRYYVITTIPFANEAAKNLVEIDAKINTFATNKEKRQFLKEKEHALFGEYEDDIRKMSMKQGHVLIKLIDRQTGRTTFDLIKDLKNGTAAFFWNTIGKMFGYSLKAEYDSEEDYQIEAIVLGYESGRNITYYDYITMRYGN